MEKISSTLTGEALITEMRKSAASIQSQMENAYNNLRKTIEAKREALEQEREVARMAAADGDATENAPLQTAYENISRLTIELAAIESSVATYENSVSPEVGEVTPGGVCSINSVVCISDVSNGQANPPTWIIRLYPAGLGNAKIGAIAIDTPLGKALLSHSKGECVQCAAPIGVIPYLIKEVI